jgi:hypothetical protein
VPPGYRLESRPRWGYIVLAGVDFAAFYGFTVAFAAHDHFENQKGWLMIPAIGPFITAVTRDGHHDEVPAFGPLVLDGLIQTFGLAFLLKEGLSPPVWMVPEKSAEARLVPYLGHDTAGFQLVGRF